MTTLLHIDSSARAGLSGRDAHGSHSRRLTARFVDRWRTARPADPAIYRDVGAVPPSPVTGEWIQAAFTPPERRETWMAQTLAESDGLVDELLAADLIVLGAPMYNFGPPAPLKAWIDNIVRVGRTFGFDRAREGEPYWPMLDAMGKTLVILSSRGDHGYAPGGRLAHVNHLWAIWASPTSTRPPSNTTNSPTRAWPPRSWRRKRGSTTWWRRCWPPGPRRWRLNPAPPRRSPRAPQQSSESWPRSTWRWPRGAGPWPWPGRSRPRPSRGAARSR
jgi:FMN-dependent NADH-azoreductase